MLIWRPRIISQNIEVNFRTLHFNLRGGGLSNLEAKNHISKCWSKFQNFEFKFKRRKPV